MTPLDREWERIREGDAAAFARWYRLAEVPLLRSLRPFRQAVDVEEVMQEGCLRIWRLAPTRDLSGPNASLRYARTVIRNLALRVAERNRLIELVDPVVLDEGGLDPIAPESPADPFFRDLVKKCLEKLPPQPRKAIVAMIRWAGGNPGTELGAPAGMKPDTCRKNRSRGRKLMRQCLEANGIEPERFQ